MDRHVVISSDCHSGPPAEAFRPFLDPQYRERFDESLREIEAAAARGITARSAIRVESQGKARRETYAAAQAVKEKGEDGGWDPDIRTRELDRDGVAGEIMFPQPRTPFRGGLGLAFKAQDRIGAEHPYELRFAGGVAYNRWLAELCTAQEPERHAGSIIVDVDDPQAAVKEIRRARKAGLFGGVNLPVMPLVENNPEMFYHHARFEPIWEVCEELDIPVQSHAFGGTPNYGSDSTGSRWINSTEIFWAAHRLFWVLLWGGVMERHPTLRVVITEASNSWLTHVVAMMDDFYIWKNPEEVRKIIPHPPSFYWDRQCFIGASPPFGRREIELRHQIGLRNIMWGSDYPHMEGTWPHTERRMRAMFAGVPAAETGLILGGNAMRCYKFDEKKLEKVAARIGPKASELEAVTEKEAQRYWKNWVSLSTDEME